MTEQTGPTETSRGVEAQHREENKSLMLDLKINKSLNKGHPLIAEGRENIHLICATCIPREMAAHSIASSIH